MSELLIGEVAQQSGVATSTIRYYESIGVLPEPRRVNGRRCYDRSVIRQIMVIRAAQNASWSLTEIKELFSDFPNHDDLSARWKANAPKKITELDAIIEATQKTKHILEDSITCNCEDLEDCTLVRFGQSL